MFDDWQLEILKALKTPELNALFDVYGGSIPLEELTPQEREIVAPYYLKRLLFEYDDEKLVEASTSLGYSKHKATKLTLERVKRHREERDAVATKEGFAEYLHVLHSYDQSIENKLLASIKKKVAEDYNSFTKVKSKH